MNYLNEQLQDSSFIVQLVYPAMVSLGLDVEAISRRCQITSDLLQSSQARFPHAAQKKFWQVVEEVSGDPLIGAHLAQVMSLQKGQVWEYLFLSSPTFGDGLNRALDYQRLFSDASQWQLQTQQEQAFLCIDFSTESDEFLRHLSEAVFLYMARYFRELTAGVFDCQAVAFTHTAGASERQYREIYGCDLLFEQAMPGLYFHAEVLTLESSRAEPELLRLHEQLASERLAKLEKQDIVLAVRQAIAEDLERGQPELADIASRLNTTARDLRTRLAAADTSFNQVLSDYRCYLAKRLLSRTSESIGDIVYLTGFSEPSTFYRAFKRWTDMTPIEYREFKQSRTSIESAG